MYRMGAVESLQGELSEAAIREQLELLVQDQAFRTSKRSVQFLRYVVEQTLLGASDQIKERSIGVEVFGREPSYDTNNDHVVRTAAIELRKRLAIYYGDEKHRNELRMSLVPGSYVPQFSAPVEMEGAHEVVAPLPVEVMGSAIGVTPMEAPRPFVVETAGKRGKGRWWAAGFAVLLIAGVVGFRLSHAATVQDRFWSPVLDSPGAVLLAVGDVPNGPPTASAPEGTQEPIPVLRKPSSMAVPFADAVTIARVMVLLSAHGKQVKIRPERGSSFADLREGPVVLIGAFNNDWSIRLARSLRYTLALDEARHLIYIKDAKNVSARNWSWATDRPTDHQGAAGGPPLEDYALISRIWNSETGHVVIVIGGLYTYGTQSAGEFLTEPGMMDAITNAAPLDDAHSNLQIVLATTVTDDAAGPPRVLAVSRE